MATKTRKTKLPTITQLPSGAYHTRVTYTDTDGKRKAVSITDYDYNTVVLRAAEAMADRKQDKVDRQQGRTSMSLAEAMAAYIDSKSAVLSPSTVRAYKATQRTAFAAIREVAVCDLTQDMIQRAVNQKAALYSPKTVRNHHGFLTSVLLIYRPDMALHTTLPQKRKREIAIPTEDEVKRMMVAAQGTPMEIPVLLAACCGLRRSEIAALTWRDIDFKKGTIKVNKALVADSENELVEKTTKTTSSTRTVRMFPLVSDALLRLKQQSPDVTGYIAPTPDNITHRFEHLLNAAQCPKYRFHDLRHYAVSVMLSLNVPKKYIASMVGHSSERMIDEVYGHIMESKKTSVEDQLQGYFEGVFGSICNEK